MSKKELRYGFGKNWSEYIERHLSDKIIDDSVEHIKRFMRVENLAGRTFLDIGCGSGIHSLAALRLGAERVFSFDYDPNSVATTEKVRAWSGQTENWQVQQGSVLDRKFMESLPKFDVVYSWGVLHHTGEMWNAVANALIPMKPNSEFYIALYSFENYTRPSPDEWVAVKHRYNRANPLRKRAMELRHVYDHVIKPELAAGRGWMAGFKNYGSRGMTVWTDVKDWLGGYPIEFASLIETRDFVKRASGLDMVNVLTGEGCTEYMFSNMAANERWRTIDEGRARVALPGPYHAAGGYAFKAHVPHLLEQSDADETPRRSRMMLYEDGKPFGFSHALHQDVRDHGKGRFSHWGDWILFSTPDNTDPNISGRSYSYVVEY